MPRWSRREFLAASSLPIVGSLAGCSSFPDRDRGDPDLGERSERPVSDYQTTKVRNGDGARLVEAESASERTHLYDHYTERSALPTFTAVPEARDLERFADATDFEAESMLLFVRPIPECYDLRLVSVTRDDDGVTSDYCRATRPADVSCSADAEDVVGIAIRLPFAGDSFNSLGMGYSRSCDTQPTVVDFEPVTPTSNATTTSETGGGDE